MPKKCVVIGCGAHASSVISIVESSVESYEILGLVDTADHFDASEKISGYHVIFNLSEMLNSPDKYRDVYCVLAIGDNQLRKAIFKKLINKKFKIPSIVSGSSIVDRTVVMGDGNIIGHAAIINAHTTLGRNSLINTGSLIEHGCNIKDHIHIGPRAVLCGGVRISAAVFVGAGAVIVPNVCVEEACIIAAGAVLISNVTEKATTFIGVPARGKNI